MRIRAAILALLTVASSGYAGTLYDWAGGSGTTLPGWTWKQDPGNQGYSIYGWAKDDGAMLGGAWWSRMGQKTDYYPTGAAGAALARIKTDFLTPTRERTLNVYEQTNTGTDGSSGWWFLNRSNLSGLGVASATDNRGDFYIYLNGINAWDPADPFAETIHLGTYTGWEGTAGGNSAAVYLEANAPMPQSYLDFVAAHGGEAQAGHHYYHTYGMPGGAWIHAQIDQHPTHGRQSSGSGKPENNPLAARWPEVGLNYMQGLNRLYLEIRYPQTALTEYYMGPLKFWTQPQQENEDSITSLWVGYWPSTGKWEVGFQDMSFYRLPPYNYDATTQSTFEIRWSTSPITNENYHLATVCEPEFHERGTTNTFKRHNSWEKIAWTRFDLPAGVDSQNSKIYFAVKDVSAVANGDGHDAVSPYIKTTDYVIGGNTPADPALPALSTPRLRGFLRGYLR